MGIPYFLKWLKTNFEKHMKKLGKGQKVSSHKIEVDNLMIDLNGLFHESTQKIYQYGSYKSNQRLLGKKRPRGLKEQLLVFEDICNHIDSIINIVGSKKQIVLCVDGPAPASKMAQQRKRRYKSSMENSIDGFDTNSLTPGTKFMDHLTKYIDWYIHVKITKDPNWKDLEIFYSSEKAAGEGEHKCISYMRKYGVKEHTYCIAGMDADLIMLALGTHFPNFWVLREDTYDTNNAYFFIDIGSIHNDLSVKMDWSKDDKKSKNIFFTSDDAINDFVLMCFMAGNDFLPNVPSIEIIEGGIDYMLDVYKNVGKSYGHLTYKNSTDNIQFIKEPMKVFLGTIAQYDKGIFEEKLKKRDTYFPDSILEKNSTYNAGKYTLDIEKYRTDYYNHNLNITDEKDIEELCHQYLEGIQWVLSYYTRGVPDWRWCFKNHYAPFAHELAKHTDTFEFQERKDTIPSTPFQQLLSVLPPKSSSLIPIPLCHLLTDSTSELKRFCPDKFEMDLAGKKNDWEAVVLLPIVDFEIIKKEYFKHIDSVDEKEQYRNKLSRSRIYTYSHNKTFEFKSFYGNIPECAVKYRNIDL